MHSHHHDPKYTGHWPTPHAAGPGFCQSCCQPSSRCHCHRDCRKEARSLIAAAATVREDPDKNTALLSDLPDTMRFAVSAQLRLSVERQERFAVGTAFIGGGCCVTLAVEYAPLTPTSTFSAAVLVGDAEGTLLLWGRTEQPGAGYRIHEGIITTKPGARLALIATNCTARVRWCEVFSC